MASTPLAEQAGLMEANDEGFVVPTQVTIACVRACDRASVRLGCRAGVVAKVVREQKRFETLAPIAFCITAFFISDGYASLICSERNLSVHEKAITVSRKVKAPFAPSPKGAPPPPPPWQQSFSSHYEQQQQKMTVRSTDHRSSTVAPVRKATLLLPMVTGDNLSVNPATRFVPSPLSPLLPKRDTIACSVVSR